GRRLAGRLYCPARLVFDRSVVQQPRRTSRSFRLTSGERRRIGVWGVLMLWAGGACSEPSRPPVAPNAAGTSGISYGHVVQFPAPAATATPGTVQVLRGPRSRESVRAVVRRFFTAVAAESHLELAELFTENAVVQ